MTPGRPVVLSAAQADILARFAAGATLTRSLLGERLWSLLEDSSTEFDDVSPRVLREAGLIALARHGSLKADRADAYRLTLAGQEALTVWRAKA